MKKVLEGNYKTLGVLLAIASGILLFIIIPITRPNVQPLSNGTSINDNTIITLQHTPSGATLELEVASTDQKREKGLMFRDYLLPNSGMIFIFPNEQPLSFWMKNTSISLDMIFLDKNLKVTSIYSNTKVEQTSEIYSSKSDSQYAIETIAGWTLSKDVVVGDLFKISSTK